MEFKPTWLYIKQHNKTGLKYFGKTIKPDPTKYLGSGKYWRAHLKKHGKDISTPWCQRFEDRDELVEFALLFSKENNIVESKEWANLIAENGMTGGDTGITDAGRERLRTLSTGRVQSDKSKQKIRDARATQPPPMLGKQHSASTIEKIKVKRAVQVITDDARKKQAASMTGHVFSEERNQKISAAMCGREFSIETLAKMAESAKRRPSEKNSMYGKHHTDKSKQLIGQSRKNNPLSATAKQNAATARIGQVWWNNAVIETRSKTLPGGSNWRRGRLPKIKEN